MLQFDKVTWKRLGMGLLVALLGAFLLASVAEAQVYKPNPCTGLTVSDPMYWMLSCWAM